MAEQERFHTSLPFDLAIDRLKHAQINGVKITVKTISDEEVTFRLDLRKRRTIGLMLTVAHLQGTIQQMKNGKAQVSYQTYPLAHYSIVVIPAIGIILTAIMILVVSPELAPIASIPGIAGVLFGLFWTMLNSDFRKNDRFRLQELLERMLEKQSSMTTWQA